jgi:hypothetical protein
MKNWVNHKKALFPKRRREGRMKMYRRMDVGLRGNHDLNAEAVQVQPQAGSQGVVAH